MTVPITRRRRRTINQINMVPFIDVMLVLLIIFMVTATVTAPQNINIPNAGQAEIAPINRIDLLITQTGEISIIKIDPAQNTKSEEIKAKSQEEAVEIIQNQIQNTPQTPIMIAADKTLQYDTIIQMMKKLKEAGINQIGLAVE